MVVAATAAYADASEYRTAIDKEDNASDSSITLDLMAVSRYLDIKLHRPSGFGQEGTSLAPVTRKFAIPYYGYPYTDLSIDDLVQVVGSVQIDANGDGTAEQTLTTNQYQLWPRNAALGSEPKPYRKIRLAPTIVLSSPYWRPSVVEGIALSQPEIWIPGIWGWPNVPAAIKSATIQFCALWRLETPRATTQISEVTGQATGVSRRAQTILDDLVSQYSREWVLR